MNAKDLVLRKGRYTGSDLIVDVSRADRPQVLYHIFEVTEFITEEEKFGPLTDARKRALVTENGLNGVKPEFGKVYLIVNEDGGCCQLTPHGRVE